MHRQRGARSPDLRALFGSPGLKVPGVTELTFTTAKDESWRDFLEIEEPRLMPLAVALSTKTAKVSC